MNSNPYPTPYTRGPMWLPAPDPDQYLPWGPEHAWQPMTAGDMVRHVVSTPEFGYAAGYALAAVAPSYARPFVGFAQAFIRGHRRYQSGGWS